MGSKARKSNRSPIISCMWAASLLFFCLIITYITFNVWTGGHHVDYIQAFGSWASRATTRGSKTLLRMSTTSFDAARQQETFEENRAIITLQENQVYVNCPPCNITSQGLYNTRETPGLPIRSPPSHPHHPSILLAIFTHPSKFELRSIHRMAYSLQTCSQATIDIVFAVGNPASQEEKAFVSSERRLFNDIITIDADEPTTTTYNFFSKISKMGNMRHDYVMKLEDDSYVRLSNLAQSLVSQPKEDLYYGYVLPCENEDAYKMYMAGMGYVLTWDLVEYIGNLSINALISDSKLEGNEDKFVGNRFNEGGKAKNRVSKKPLFYDHPEHGGACAHEFVSETILIHQITSTKRWIDVLSFFEPNM